MDLPEAKKSLDLLRAVVSKTVQLNAGDDGRCPFHEDTSPSFRIYVNKDGRARFYCRGCGAGGDVVDFVSRTQNLGFNQSVNYISAITDVEVDAPVLSSSPQRPWEPSPDCFLQCQNYANLGEDYNLLLEENRELRHRLDIGDFGVGNEDPRIQRVVAATMNWRIKDIEDYADEVTWLHTYIRMLEKRLGILKYESPIKTERPQHL
jgi:hypothetical protein